MRKAREEALEEALELQPFGPRKEEYRPEEGFLGGGRRGYESEALHCCARSERQGGQRAGKGAAYWVCMCTACR